MDYSNSALMVIDLQEDFLPPHGSLAVAGGRDIIQPIINLLTLHPWKTVVATKDWHPQDHVSFASTHEGKKPFEIIDTLSPLGNGEKKQQVLWPDHCVQGSPGSKFPPEFEQAFEHLENEHKLVLKGYLQDREYYSCFQDVWGIHKTECTEYLKSLKIETVYVVGLAYDYCVLNSSVDAKKAGFRTVVLEDLTRAVDPSNTKSTKALYEQGGVELLDSSVLTS